MEFRAGERYRYYVVWFLFVVYVFNFVDRQILTTLMEPIKKESGCTTGSCSPLEWWSASASRVAARRHSRSSH